MDEITRRAVGGLALVAVGLIAIVGCASSGRGGNASQSAAPTVSRESVKIVALGDSDATGMGDSTGLGWVGAYGDLVETNLNTPVTVNNLAAGGKTSDELRNEVSSDDSLRQVLSQAEVILIGIGGADLNAGDDALSSGDCKGRQCYAPLLKTFDANIKAIASEIHRLAPTAVLRAISLPNVVPGAHDVVPKFITEDIAHFEVVTERASICQAMRSNGGQCADAVLAFNGENASGDAYKNGLLTKDPCCYPSTKGQQLIATLVAATGLEGLQGAL
jgi:lysophospholipase L1-like esterase